MASTGTNLYRSIRKEQFPDGVFDDDGQPVPGVLDPDFYPKDIGGGRTRAADVEIRVEKGVEYVMPGGGTSLFDRAGVFKGNNWLSFEIPAGTAIPDSLIVRQDGWRERFQATHYQIELRNRMTKGAMQGALDNFARNAIARSVQLSRASTTV